MSELNASNLRKEHGNEGPDLVGTTELTSPYFMVPPSGTTAQRPQNPQKGTLRFNTDIGSLEYFKGDTIGWEQIVRTSPNLGGGTGSNTGTGVRGLHMGGFLNPGQSDVIDYITIPTLGNAIDFGNLTAANRVNGGCASRTRGISAGGYVGSISDVIQYVTISSTGDALDFGDLTLERYNVAGLSNQIRGIFAAGEGSPNSWINIVDYITIAQTGNAVDFGDIQNQNGQIGQNNGVSSPTRGVIGGSYISPGAYVNTTGYVTISTTGDFVDFGDLTEARGRAGGIHNATRGIFTGGFTPGSTNTIDFITISTLGNATDFGDQLYPAASLGCCSSPTRGTAAGGYNSPAGPTIVNTIGYLEIATTGNLTDFGDLSVTRGQTRGISNGHGGL